MSDRGPVISGLRGRDTILTRVQRIVRQKFGMRKSPVVKSQQSYKSLCHNVPRQFMTRYPISAMGMSRSPTLMEVKKRPRTAFTPAQIKRLENEFQRNKYLSVGKRLELSKGLKLTETQVVNTCVIAASFAFQFSIFRRFKTPRNVMKRNDIGRFRADLQ